MKRPLFVFAGQSNMMGAAVYDAKEQIHYKNSYEYLHKPRRLGAKQGDFKQYGFPVGEFSYKDIKAAYGENPDINAKSTLDIYAENTFFSPSMSNLADDESKAVHPFAIFSEATTSQMAVALPPFIVKGLEDEGYCCAFTHITKGGVSIRHFIEGDAKDYFYQKLAHFFDDCEKRFEGDDMSQRVCVWLQGESDRNNGYDFYTDSLHRFWSELQSAGITHLLIIRPSYWNDAGTDALRAQEDFCASTEGAYMLTRAASFIPWKGQDRSLWFVGEVGEEYEYCRDSFYGFGNQHINEKGFRLIASRAVPNIIRLLFEGLPPILEDEMVLPLINR